MENKEIVHQVTLKKLTRDHLDDFYSWASDPEVAEQMTWEAYNNKNEALQFLINVAETHPFFKAICFENKVVGSLTLMPGKGHNACRAELGYVLAKRYWGKGITTAAVIKAIEAGFHDLKVKRIEAFVDPDNLASRRVLEKAGMKCEELLKDHLFFKDNLRDRYIYAITR